MPFPVVNRQGLVSFGLGRVPSASSIKRWQKRGFPKALSVPKGYYPEAAVRAWFEQQASKSMQ
jgi:hypothetical protein